MKHRNHRKPTSLWSIGLEAWQDGTGPRHLKMQRAPAVNQLSQEMGAGGSSKLRFQMPIFTHKLGEFLLYSPSGKNNYKKVIFFITI